MSNDYRPEPPDDKGWYCVNFFTDMFEAVPGHIICKPEVVWWDPADDEIVAYDPLGYAAGGQQSRDLIAIWGQPVIGKAPPDWEPTLPKEGG